MHAPRFRPLILAVALAAGLAACNQAATPAEPAPGPAAAAPAVEAATPIQAESGTYALDPSHTIVLAQWNHLGFSNPSLNFAGGHGQIVYDAADPSASRVQVTFPLSGITSYNADFDTHLASADFFDVAKFPEARFQSTSVSANGSNRFTVTGDLTIKGITRPVTLDVTLNGAGPHPMLKTPSIGFDATGTVKRSDWGLDYGAPAVSDAVQLRITTEASRVADAAAAAPAQAEAAPATPDASPAP